MCVCMYVCQGGIVSVSLGTSTVALNRVQRLREISGGYAGTTITAIVEKTRIAYTALKADKAVSRGECGKHRTPPPVSRGDAGKTITAIVEKTRIAYTALKADKAVSRGECGKHRTPPPVSAVALNRVQRNVKKVV